MTSRHVPRDAAVTLCGLPRTLATSTSDAPLCDRCAYLVRLRENRRRRFPPLPLTRKDDRHTLTVVVV